MKRALKILLKVLGAILAVLILWAMYNFFVLGQKDFGITKSYFLL